MVFGSHIHFLVIALVMAVENSFDICCQWCQDIQSKLFGRPWSRCNFLLVDYLQLLLLLQLEWHVNLSVRRFPKHLKLFLVVSLVIWGLYAQ